MGERDNVATLIAEGNPGDECQLRGQRSDTIILRAHIPYGHKIAITTLSAGDEVKKYNEVIGRMTQGAEPGDHIHVHNVESIRGRGDLVKAARDQGR